MPRTATDALADMVARGRTAEEVFSIARARGDEDLLAAARERFPEAAAAEDAQAPPAAKAEPLAQAEGADEVRLVPVGRIAPHADNRHVDPEGEGLRRLALSLDSQGLIQPIVVRQLDERDGDLGYEIVCGERRWLAARRLGWETIPARVVRASAEEAQALRLTENLQREDVPPLEQAAGVAWLLARHHGDAPEVARRLGVSDSWVYTRARLENLSPAWRRALQDPETAARYASVRDHVTFQIEIAKLPHATQDRLLDLSGYFLARLTLAELRRVIGGELRLVKERPWSAAFERRCERRCRGCADRSDTRELKPLFADLHADKQGAYCLDPGCWADKARAWVRAQAEKARRENGDVLLVALGGESFEGLADLGEPVYDFQVRTEPPADDEDRAAFRERVAVRLDGPRAGEIVRVWTPPAFEPDQDDADDREARERADAEQRAQDAAQRAQDARNAELRAMHRPIEAFLAPLADPDAAGPEPPAPRFETLLRLAVAMPWEVSEALAGDLSESVIDCSADVLRDRVWHAVALGVWTEIGLWWPLADAPDKTLRLAALLGGEDLQRACEQALAEAGPVDEEDGA